MCCRTPLYQTLRDKGNVDEIENKGPFLCKKRGAWLGNGYYFWENNVGNAHWWGKNFKEGYIICRSYYIYDNKNFFDFMNPNHIEIFRVYVLELEKKYNYRKLTVSFVLEFLKKQKNFAKYKAIRCYPSKQDSENIMYFNENKNIKAFLDLRPPVQICVFDKSFLCQNIYEIIYPETYSRGYVG